MKKSALVTGAGTGIGLAVTRKLLNNQWAVFAHYHTSVNPLKELQKGYGKERVILIKADFGNRAAVKKFLATIRKIKFNALVNNAADYDNTFKSKDRIRGIEHLLMVNTIVPTLIAETVLARMKLQKKGSIVNISSIASKYGSGAEHVFYGVSKRGLEAATKTLAREGAPFNVLVNTVRPGVTDTSFHRKHQKSMRKRTNMIPLKRLALAEEIGDFIYYLCSEDSFITNEILTVAGGE